MRLADRVKDSTTTTGTGSITLSGTAATGGFQTFANAFGAAAPNIPYCIVDSANNAWEVGIGTLSGSTTLARDTVLASSNSNALVNFASGTKDVFCTAAASILDNDGCIYAHSRGMAMP